MKTWHELRRFPLAIRLLLINQFGVNTGFYLLIPYLAVHLGEDLGMSAAVVGIVLGVRNLSQQGLFLIGGSASDRLGARGVIIAGCALRTVGFGLFALGDGLAVLLAASVLSGLAGALFNPAVRAYLAQRAGSRQAEVFALFNVFATTGALVGPLLGSALLLVDFRVAALTAAALFALLTVAQALVLPACEVPLAAGGVLADWREVLGHRVFVAFAMAMVGMFTLQNQLYLLLPDGARRATGWDGAAGLVFLVGTLANLALQMRLTRALKERGERTRWIAAGLGLMGLAFVPPMAVAGLEAPPGGPGAAVLRVLPVLAGALLLYLGVMIAQPFVMELIPAFGRAGLTGTYFGLFYVVSGVAAAVGNAVVGWAMDAGSRMRTPWLPWACCLAFGLLSAAGVAWLHRLRALPGRTTGEAEPPAPDQATATDRTTAPTNGANLLTDNPELYEARFPDAERLAGRWAEDCLRRHRAGRRVLDLGCGTGRDAAHLHRAGRRVVGADLSTAMLTYARTHHPGPEYLRADLRTFDLPAAPFDAVVCLDSALLYCHTNAELDGFLASCRRGLVPGGLLVAEMRNGAFFLGRTELLDAPAVHGFTWQGTAYTSTTTLSVDRTAQLLRRTRRWTADDGSPPHAQDSAWRLLFPQELRQVLAAHGFQVLELHDGPGPRTEPAWQDGTAPGTSADGDRLHLVARLTRSD